MEISWTLIIISLILGVILLVLEIVALPGLIAGIFGAGLIVFGIWQSYLLGGPQTGTLILLASFLFCILMLILLIRKKPWRRFILNDEVDGKVNIIEEQKCVAGNRGTTISRLAPTGKALINGTQMEVHAINKYIEPDRPIEVVAVEGYRIDVREIDDNRFSENS